MHYGREHVSPVEKKHQYKPIIIDDSVIRAKLAYKLLSQIFP